MVGKESVLATQTAVSEICVSPFNISVLVITFPG